MRSVFRTIDIMPDKGNPFLVFVVIAAIENIVCENFNRLAIAVLEIQPGDRQTDGQTDGDRDIAIKCKIHLPSVITGSALHELGVRFAT
jgi:hypothetical protein